MADKAANQGGAGGGWLRVFPMAVGLGALALIVVVLLVFRGPSGPDADAVARNNRAVGLMGQYEYTKAMEIFQSLVDEYPDWTAARVNLAIAILNRQEEGDNETALAMLNGVLTQDPEDLRAQYCAGLLKLYLESPADAMAHFRRVAEADPNDAYAAYYVGQCLFQEQQFDEAVTWFERALELDPYLRSAYYNLGQAYQRLDRVDEARSMLEQFQTLQENPRARLVRFIYTEMGPKGLALAIDEEAAPSARPPAGPLFGEAAALLADATLPAGVSWASESDLVSVTTCDVDDDGRLDLFLAGALAAGDERRSVLARNTGDGFALDADHPLTASPDTRAVLWGDYDNDGRTDAYLCRRGPNQLWRRTETGWEDVTTSTGTAGGDLETVDGAMFDADHDGDLDLFLVNADGDDELFNNNLDGTFRPLAAERGLTGDGRPSRRVIVADLDGRRDLDIVVIHAEPPHAVYLNDRLWNYRVAPGFERFVEAPAWSGVAADVDADGAPELWTIDPEGGLHRWTDEDGTWRNQQSWQQGAGSAGYEGPPGRVQIADVSGDGRLDVLWYRHGHWLMLAGGEASPDQPPWSTTDTPTVGAALAILSPDRGPSLVTVPPGTGPQLRGPGAGRFPFAALTFSGLEDRGKSMRSNASGIGTQIAVRVGSRWTVADTLRTGSGPGQSLQPIAIGLGGASRIDFVSIDWSDGVFQSEVDLGGGQLHEITETQRQLSSCPVLFAWDGARYAFVSDVLGVGGMGFAVAPGEYAESRPWENFLFPHGLLQPNGDRYEIKIGEPMEEACYLDAAHLVAWDVPAGWSMTVDDRFAIGGPAPSGEVRTWRRLARPVSAVNDRDENVLAAVAEADLHAAPVGPIDRRFIGRLESDHMLTLEFDEQLDVVGTQPILLADGWVEYPYSQTMFSAAQARADYRAPTLEARGADGTWHVVVEQFGYPAGMPRQMSLPLPSLPSGTRALRLTTNQEIYWDALAVAFVEPCPDLRRTKLPLARADLRRTGFAFRPDLPQRRPWYDYDQRAPLWDTRHQAGFYTRFGPVGELVEATDDAVAIFGPGEEVHLAYEAALPELPEGWTRRFVLESAGWCKDMDLFTRDGETVGPLPSTGRDPEVRDALHERFNTRFEAGR